MKRRLVCPRNGEPSWCHVCKETVPHRREEWAEKAECEAHRLPLEPAR